MSDNSSASNSSSQPYICNTSGDSLKIFIAMFATRAALSLPLCTLVFYLGHQQWRRRRSFTATSHSDIFTYHMAAMDLIWVLGCFVSICGLVADQMQMILAGVYATSIVFYGETFFHILTSVERYLAVVHPVTYMGLKSARGVTIRNISIGCVWLLSFASLGLTHWYEPNIPTVPYLCLLVISLIVISFCCLSILCVLIRPGPGEGGGEKRVDQSKLRAFHTITAIMAVLWLWFAGLIISIALENSSLHGSRASCLVLIGVCWFNLPSSMILLVLYLHRAGKLSCCCY